MLSSEFLSVNSRNTIWICVINDRLEVRDDVVLLLLSGYLLSHNIQYFSFALALFSSF
jgi:hypothetical protein